MLTWEILPCYLFLCCPHPKNKRGTNTMGKNSLRNWPYRVVSQYLKALIRYVSEPPPLVNFNQGQFLTFSWKHYEFGHWVHMWPPKTKYHPGWAAVVITVPWIHQMRVVAYVCGNSSDQIGFRRRRRSERPVCGLLAFASCCFPAGLACWMALQLIKYKLLWLACVWLPSWKAAQETQRPGPCPAQGSGLPKPRQPKCTSCSGPCALKFSF